MGFFVPLRSGWAPASPADYYPQDLPEEWRLAYFANEIDAVLVPFDLWRLARPETLAEWCEDVPPGFGFFLEGDSQATPAVESTTLAELLGPAFKGVVPSGEGSPRSWLRPRSAFAQRPFESGGLVYQVPEALRRDLRRARVWLETLEEVPADHSLLLLLGQVEVDVVRQWQIALDLLGLPRRP